MPDITTLLSRFLEDLYSGTPSIGPGGELTVSSSSVTSTVPYVGPDGSAAAPTFGNVGNGFNLAGASLRLSVGSAYYVGLFADQFQFKSSTTLDWSNGTVGAASDLSISRQSAGTLVINGATATPAGGSTSARLVFGTTAGFGIYVGSGLPTVSAAQGSIYLRSDGSSSSTRLYVNSNGTTGWVAVTTAS